MLEMFCCGGTLEDKALFVFVAIVATVFFYVKVPLHHFNPNIIKDEGNISSLSLSSPC